MKRTNQKIFKQAVTDFFVPIVKNAGLAIEELREGIYEVPSQNFTMRIRRGTGHRQDILVTLMPTAVRPDNLDDLSKEVGLGVFARYQGEKLEEPLLDSEADYFRYAGNVANAAEKFLFPYLMGHRSDFSEIRARINTEIETRLKETREYRFLRDADKDRT